MSREIKFRGQREDKKWLYGSLIVYPNGATDITFYDCRWQKYSTVEPETVGQYTGLKDKNGVEIYELDYAEKDGCIYLVMWYKNKYILKDISNGDIIELDKNINVRSNYYENAEKFTREYSKI